MELEQSFGQRSRKGTSYKFTEDDIALSKEMGANCVRIPFNCRLVEYENRPSSLNEEGLSYLDRAVEWCAVLKEHF